MSKSDTCPHCKLAGWKKRKFEQHAIQTYGQEVIQTKNSGTVTLRYKRCLNCAYKWITEEKYLKDVGANGG